MAYSCQLPFSNKLLRHKETFGDRLLSEPCACTGKMAVMCILLHLLMKVQIYL